MEDLMQRSAQQAKPGKDKEARQPQGSQQHGPKAKREPAGNAPARGTGKQKGSASQPAAPVPLKQPAYQVKEHSHVHSNPFDGLDQDGRVSDDSDSTGRRSSQPGSIKEGQQLSKDDQLPSRQIVQSHAGGSRSKAGPEGDPVCQGHVQQLAANVGLVSACSTLLPAFYASRPGLVNRMCNC